ncbi:MAG: YncE family protein [Micropepsaceae bacterium]
MRAALLCLFAVCVFVGVSRADEIELDRLETEELDLLYFDPPQTYLTPYAARAALNSIEFQKRIFDWKPWEKITLLLKDFTDNGNAAARSSPNNALLIDVAPLSQAFETMSGGERIYVLMNHELVHVATMDVWNEQDAFWRNLFMGKPMPMNEHPESILYNYLATPRVNAPRWFLEGSAVFMETWMAGGLGRAQGAYDEMVFRAMVRDNAHFYSPLGLEAEGSSVDFQVGVNAYLYGTRFMSYLALNYSPEKMVEWLKRGPESDGYYSNQFERVFGRPLDDAWADWIAWERTFQAAALQSVRQHPLTPVKRLSQQALGSVSRVFHNASRDTLIGGFRYPGVIAHIGELSLKTGDVRRLVDIKGPMHYRVTSLAYDPSTNTAWYTTDNNAFRDIVEIDIGSGTTKKLIKDGRIGDLVFSKTDRALWGLRHLNGFVTLVRMEAPYEKWTQVYTWPYGEVPFDLDVSPDGQSAAMSISKINGAQILSVFKLADLNGEKPQPIATYNFGAAVPEGFVFSPDGRSLYGSSYYTGVSNIYRFDIATQKVEAMSNAETGFFRPIVREDGSLIVLEYTGDGFSPVAIDARPLTDLSAVKFLGNEVVSKHPVVKTWAVGSPSKVALDEKIVRRGKYVPSDEMGVGATYPIAQGYKGYGTFGWHLMLEDTLQFAKLYVTASYSPTESLKEAERFHLNVEYKTVNGYLRYWHNDADFYDLFGPTERSRKGDAFLAGYRWPLIYDPPIEMNFHADIGYFIGLDTLPGNQNVQPSASEIGTFEFKVDYKDTDKSLGAVDHEKGYRFEAAWGSEFADSAFFPRGRAGFDFGFPTGWAHSSIWLYSSAGITGGDKNNPLTPFYFGGFKNNYVDDKEVKRYREFDTLPGFEIDEVAARNFAKSVLEWNLPPVRFEDVGTPSIYLGSIRPAVFASVLFADMGLGTERTVGNAGAQIDFNFTLAHRLPMTFSVGYAAGIEDWSMRDEEWLISLKIM